jgi:hypothetical protein
MLSHFKTLYIVLGENSFCQFSSKTYEKLLTLSLVWDDCQQFYIRKLKNKSLGCEEFVWGGGEGNGVSEK